MANSNTHQIIIKNETKSGGNSPLAGSSDKSESKYTAGQTGAQNVIKAVVAYDKFVAPFVEQAIQTKVNTIELRTGSAELQQRVQFGLSVAKSTGGILSSLLTGYAIGKLPGAVIGATIGIATTVMNYSNKAKVIGYQKNLESITLRGMNVRAGGYAPSYGASRLGNQ